MSLSVGLVFWASFPREKSFYFLTVYIQDWVPELRGESCLEFWVCLCVGGESLIVPGRVSLTPASFRNMFHFHSTFRPLGWNISKQYRLLLGERNTRLMAVQVQRTSGMCVLLQLCMLPRVSKCKSIRVQKYVKFIISINIQIKWFLLKNKTAQEDNPV